MGAYTVPSKPVQPLVRQHHKSGPRVGRNDQVWIIVVMSGYGTDEGLPYSQRRFTGRTRWPRQRLPKHLNRCPIRLFVSYIHLFALEQSTGIFPAHPQQLHLRDPMGSLPRLLHPLSGVGPRATVSWGQTVWGPQNPSRSIYA